VKILTEAGADINSVDKKGKMPLNYAEKHKSEPRYAEICEYLLKKGAKRTWRTEETKEAKE